jgi:hypothetical protein
VFQLFAIMSGLADWIGLHWIIAAPLSFFIANIPLLGTVIGMFGAVEAWNWSGTQAFALFFVPFVAIAALAFISDGFDRRKQKG